MGVDYLYCSSCEEVEWEGNFMYCNFCCENVCLDCINNKYRNDKFLIYDDDKQDYIKPNDYWCYSCDKIKEINDKRCKIKELIDKILSFTLEKECKELIEILKEY